MHLDCMLLLTNRAYSLQKILYVLVKKYRDFIHQKRIYL